MTMERGLSFGSRGPQSDFARLCWRVRIQNNNHQRHATTQGVSHAAVKHPARFRGLRAPHALYCAHQPNSAVKPTPTSSACGCPPCFALRRGLPRALGCAREFDRFSATETSQLPFCSFARSRAAFDLSRVAPRQSDLLIRLRSYPNRRRVGPRAFFPLRSAACGLDTG